MAALSDLLEQNESTKDYAATVKTAELVIGTVSQVYGYYQLGMSIGEELGLWGHKQENQLENLAKAIEALWGHISDCFGQLDAELKSEFDGLTAKLRDEPLSKLSGYVTYLAENQGKLDTIDANRILSESIPPMDQLTRPDQWTRIFYEVAAYQEAWTGLCWPKEVNTDESGKPQKGAQQFDYLGVLPAFLEGLANRLTIIGILDGENIGIEKYGIELQPYANKLLEIYENSYSEIRTLRKPDREETMFTYGWTPSESIDTPPMLVTFPRWEQSNAQSGPHEFFRYGKAFKLSDLSNPLGTGGLYGAFDARSTVASVEPYPSQPLRPSQFGYSEAYPGWAAWLIGRYAPTEAESVRQFQAAELSWYDNEIERLHGLRSLRHWKNVYASLSLRSVWNMRNHILILLGQPPEAPPERTDLWSLRDATDAIRDAITPNIPRLVPPGFRYSLRAITDFCNTEHSLAALQRV
jgi:hypothetical protein